VHGLARAELGAITDGLRGHSLLGERETGSKGDQPPTADHHLTISSSFLKFSVVGSYRLLGGAKSDGLL